MFRPPSPLLGLALLISSLIIVLPGCDARRPAKLPEGERPPGAPNDQPAMTTVQIADLVDHAAGVFTYKGKLFSGRAVELSESGERLRENHYWEGYKHGPIREFYDDGSIRSDYNYEKGVPNGPGFEWDIEGNRTDLYFRDGVETERLDPQQKKEK